jgi:hypothetical protein
MPRIIAYPWTGEGSTTKTLTLTRADLSTETYAYTGTWHAVTSLADYVNQLVFITDAAYDPATRRVTMSHGVTAFRPTFADNLGEWFGFNTLAAGYATSWTGDADPACVLELTSATIEPPQDWAQVEPKVYSHGRARPIVWGNHQIHEVLCCCKASAAAPFRAGYVTTGKVRIVDDGEVSPNSAAAPRGYLDGWVVGSTDLVEDGDIGEILTFTLWIAVAR